MGVSGNSVKTHTKTLSRTTCAHTLGLGKILNLRMCFQFMSVNFELNWRHPIGCGTGTEIKGRGIYWIQISSNTTRTDKSGVLFKVSSIIHVFRLHFRREKKKCKLEQKQISPIVHKIQVNSLKYSELYRLNIFFIGSIYNIDYVNNVMLLDIQHMLIL